MSEKKTTILYIDDEEINLFLFERRFENDFHVITADSGLEGLEKLKSKSEEVNVVISDMQMPKMNGLEFIALAKNENNNAPYFILTGYEFNLELENALDTKLIDQIFKKPFDFDQIKDVINKTVEAIQ